MFFDRQTYAFEGSFVFDSNVKMPTTLFLNKDYFYTQGYELQLEADGKIVTEGFEVSELIPNHVEIKIIDLKLNGALITLRATPTKAREIFE